MRSEAGHAYITLDDTRIASLSQNPDGSFELLENKQRFHLTRKVDGEMRPFSLLVTLGEKQVLKIRDRLFVHNGTVYVISNVPENRSKESYLAGPKYISRLDNIDPKEIDLHVSSQAERRLRGTRVGEISGIGSIGKGHHVKIESPELQDIGLLLAVSSFIINTTHAGARKELAV
ncbi:MAG: hypothetical protein ACYC7D_12945 [Nitrososphaerales archaeon]